jgi:hypothetical protein
MLVLLTHGRAILYTYSYLQGQVQVSILTVTLNRRAEILLPF